ncbi:MAG: hypothetical protein A3F67_00930 [Verrucomicrobia bacterium RIFCSPHIGHO2_12_FULL_41_10]|nr:MAG: hypothetical protein A3F67_00930 [Verrucomicrobia bacterium RIFCSPHIGHO2_12_FULL_41_10]
MSENIQELLESILKAENPLAAYRDEANLRDDLNLDSLDIISFLFEIEIRAKIKIPEADIDSHQLFVLGNLRRYIERKIEAEELKREMVTVK